MAESMIGMGVVWDDAPKAPWAFGPSTFLQRLFGGASIGAQVALTPTPTGDGTLDVDVVKRAQGFKDVQKAPSAMAVPSFEASRTPSSVTHDLNPAFGEAPTLIQPSNDLLQQVLPDLPPLARAQSQRRSLAGLNPWDDEYSTWGEEAVIGISQPPILYPVGGSSTPVRGSGSRANAKARPVRVTLRTTRKSQERMWRRRRYERKGGAYAVYLGMMRAVTATYGAATEVQDFIEVMAWNSYGRDGRLAMMTVRQEAFAGQKVEKGDVWGAMQVNARAYALVAQGLADGTFRLDLGGALFDYGVQQTQDAVIAAQGKAYQSIANKAGWSAPVGIEALLNMHGRQLDAPQERNFDVYSPLQPFSDAFSQRVWWSSSRGSGSW